MCIVVENHAKVVSNIIVYKLFAEYFMLKNIALSADEQLIALARAKASRKHKTLNAEFRLWLESYVGKAVITTNYLQLMKNMSRVESNKSFVRDELNEE